jgi:hypothetical protein
MDRTVLGLGQERDAVLRWETALRGFGAHRPVVDLAVGSVYLSDGWGKGSYSAVHFRRLDLATGKEVAKVRLGNLVRCFAFCQDRRELIAATDSRLVRLDASTLARMGRWDDRIPRYANSMAVRGSSVLLANYLRPGIGIVDLSTGEVRRRRTSGMLTVLDGRTEPLLVSGEGGVSCVDMAAVGVKQILDTPPIMTAALSADGDALWIIAGAPFYVNREPTGVSVGPCPPGSELTRYRLVGDTDPVLFELPLPARTMAVGRDEMWLSNGPAQAIEPQYVLTLPAKVGTEPARIWRLPPGNELESLQPDAGLILTLKPDMADSSAILRCFDLQG